MMTTNGKMGPALAKALLAAQQKFPTVAKGKTVTVETKGGGSYSYDYAPLPTLVAAVRPPLAEEGILLTFGARSGDVATMLSCELVHAESGESYSAELPVSLPEDPKAAGSKITYFKRYLLGIATGVVTSEEDDDGQAASEDASRRRSSSTGQARSSGPAGNGKTDKDKAIAYAEKALTEAFGGEKPWEPREKLSTIKDLIGRGDWSDFLRLPWPTMRELFSTTAHPELNGKSRFDRGIELVLMKVRRPEACEPHDWPHGWKDDVAPTGEPGPADGEVEAAERAAMEEGA
jgi:hypothetical protein